MSRILPNASHERKTNLPKEMEKTNCKFEISYEIEMRRSRKPSNKKYDILMRNSTLIQPIKWPVKTEETCINDSTDMSKTLKI